MDRNANFVGKYVFHGKNTSSTAKSKLRGALTQKFTLWKMMERDNVLLSEWFHASTKVNSLLSISISDNVVMIFWDHTLHP